MCISYSSGPGTHFSSLIILISADLEMAIAYWNIVLKDRFRFLDIWCQFLQVSLENLVGVVGMKEDIHVYHVHLGSLSGPLQLCLTCSISTLYLNFTKFYHTDNNPRIVVLSIVCAQIMQCVCGVHTFTCMCSIEL